jgi:biopolymer transport protein ExbB/TolQ
MQFFPMLFALVATLLFRFYVARFYEPGGFAYELFLPGGSIFEQLIPLSIMFLFFWSLADLAIKYRGIRLQSRSLSHEAVQNSPDRVARLEIDEALQALQGAHKKDRAGYVFRTVESLIEHLKMTGDTQRSHEYFRHQIDIDAEATSSGYTVVRIFIWAMPILGFIGTVVGISLAVGDFSGFLSGDIDDIELVKLELANVSNGLSFAFNTTLLGLVTSLVAMLFTTYMQRRSEELTRSVEEVCLGIVAGAGQPGVPVIGKVSSGDLVESMQSFAEMVGQESERIREGFDAFNNRFLQVGDRIVAAYSQLGSTLEERTAVSAEQMQESTSRLSDALTDASRAFYETTSALSRDLESFAPDLGGVKTAIAQGLERVDSYNSQFEEVLRANTRQVVETQEKLGEKILDGIGRIDQSSAQFEETLRTNSMQLAASQDQLAMKLEEGIDRLDRSNAQFSESLQETVQQVVGSQDQLAGKITDGLGQIAGSQDQLGGKLSEGLRQLAGSQEQLAGKISEGLGQVGQSNQHFEQVLRDNTQQVVTSQEKLGEKMENIRPTHEMIVKVTESIDNSIGALHQMREVHKTLLPVLEELRGPMEFKMVPASKKPDSDDEQ